MWLPTARPKRTADHTAAWFSTGNVPGRPRQTGSVAEFGSAPNAADDHEKILDLVASWECTSNPITTSYLLFPGPWEGPAPPAMGSRELSSRSPDAIRLSPGPWEGPAPPAMGSREPSSRSPDAIRLSLMCHLPGDRGAGACASRCGLRRRRPRETRDPRAEAPPSSAGRSADPPW